MFIVPFLFEKCKLTRRHLERRMYPRVIVYPDRAIHFGDEFTERSEAMRISKVNFELVVKTLLIPVLPGAARFGARDE